MKFNNIKINCSDLPTLMLNDTKPLTDKQQEELDRLSSIAKLTNRQKRIYEGYLERVDRCQLNNILTDASKKLLKEVYVKEKYNKSNVSLNKEYSLGLINGTLSETNSLRIVSEFNGIVYKVNKDLVYNRHLKGKLDAYEGTSIKKATKVIEIKTATSMQSLLCTLPDKDDFIKKHYWQLMGYLSMTKADLAEIYHVVGNYHESIIQQTISRYLYKVKGLALPKEMIKNNIESIRNNLTFEEIPVSERIFKISAERDEEKIKMIAEKVKAARAYLKEFQEIHLSMNL
jgi:hypothetical protein